MVFIPLWSLAAAPPCANTGLAISSSATKTRNIILVRICFFFLLLNVLRGGGSDLVLGGRRLTLEADHAVLMFVRRRQAHVNHREQSKNVSLQKRDENVQTHKNSGHHQIGQAQKY